MARTYFLLLLVSLSVLFLSSPTSASADANTKKTKSKVEEKEDPKHPVKEAEPEKTETEKTEEKETEKTEKKETVKGETVKGETVKGETEKAETDGPPEDAFTFPEDEEKEEEKEELPESRLKLDELTDEQKAIIKSESEPHEFQAEVYRLMDIIINSLYTHKEVFLRELISNSADALEKIRFLSLEDPAALGQTADLRIVVDYDADAKTLSVTDSGVGMTKQDLINNLGTVAKSGTSNFLEALASGGDVNLIGQFGVGFYSAFLVADKVTVTSKHNDDSQHIWVSTADASFTVVKDPRGNTLGRGTRVTLHLKDDAIEFAKRDKVTAILNKYSQFVNFPLYLRIEEKKTVEEPIEDAAEDKEKDEDVDVVEGEEAEKKPKTKKVQKTVFKLEVLNKQKPIWLRPKEEITEKEYLEFYRSLIRDINADAPLQHVHFSAEGEIEFRAILYIPAKQGEDPYQGFFGKKQDVKLYVRRVLVAEQFEDIIPNWMTFLKGVIDSDDLPLKVDREAVSQHKVMKVISKRVSRKILDVLRKMCSSSDKAGDDLVAMEAKAVEDGRKGENEKIEWAEDETTKIKELNTTLETYDTFWKQFGKNVKLGCMEDDGGNRAKIAKLLRFYTSKSTDKAISLQKVVDRMGENQTTIYYMSGDSPQKMVSSPLIKGFTKKDFEVILLTEAVDEPCVAALNLFEGKKLQSIEKGDIDLEETETEKEYFNKLKELYKPLTEWWRPYITGQTKVKGKFGSWFTKVALSNRLVDDPVGVTASSYGITAFNEKVYRYQTFSNTENLHYQRINKVLEINPQHPLIRKMAEILKSKGDCDELKSHADFLLETALLSTGYQVEDPPSVAKKLYRALATEMKVDLSKDLPDVDVSGVTLESKKDESKKTGEDSEAEEENLEDELAGMNMHKLKVPDSASDEKTEKTGNHDEL